jgi:hypothetical protein
MAASSAVATGDGTEVRDAVDAPVGLVTQSMAVAEPGAGEYTRYRPLLETLRQSGGAAGMSEPARHYQARRTPIAAAGPPGKALS